jgi:hypothetical protein
MASVLKKWKKDKERRKMNSTREEGEIKKKHKKCEVQGEGEGYPVWRLIK